MQTPQQRRSAGCGPVVRPFGSTRTGRNGEAGGSRNRRPDDARREAARLVHAPYIGNTP